MTEQELQMKERIVKLEHELSELKERIKKLEEYNIGSGVILDGVAEGYRDALENANKQGGSK
mgnify:CR=1 FL=1